MTTVLTWQRPGGSWWSDCRGRERESGPCPVGYFEKWPLSLPLSITHTAAARNHDRRWRIQLSRRDKSSLEMEKRLIPQLPVSFPSLKCALKLLFQPEETMWWLIVSLPTSPQWKTRWVVLRKPSPVAGMCQTFSIFAAPPRDLRIFTATQRSGYLGSNNLFQFSAV